MSEDKNKQIPNSTPKTNEPKPKADSGSTKQVNESFGDQHGKLDINKSFIHTDPTITKPKK